MAEQETKFADGLLFKTPGPNVPKWILGNISIKVEEFIEFLQANKKKDGWVNIDVKKSKGGKIYCALNTYERARTDKEDEEYDRKADEAMGDEIEAEEDDGIPF